VEAILSRQRCGNPAFTLLSPAFSAPAASTAGQSAAIGTTVATSAIPHGFFFLAPLIGVIPSSLMILNRARTRNRKPAFIVAYLDPARHSRGDAGTSPTLAAVRQMASLPWETALNVVQRGLRIHVAPALIHMFSGFFVIEILCLALGIS
jgi:hypothetical protein